MKTFIKGVKTLNLNEYLLDKGIKKYKFAEEFGISIGTVSAICNGKKINQFMAKSIETFTSGKVSAEEICNNIDGLNRLRKK